MRASGIHIKQVYREMFSSPLPTPLQGDIVEIKLTLMASSLYRLLGRRIGNGYETAKSRHLFRDLVDATAQVTITKKEIEVRFQKRAHNPLLLAAGFEKTNLPIPWLDDKRLRLVFG